jgi:hypothetical protein
VRGDDWFDPVLSTDTELFVDPFRVYLAKGAWTTAHDELILFFNEVLKLVAKSGGRPSSAHWKAAERLLLFPEPAEFCLGYGDTPLGAGTGEELRDRMMEAARVTVFDLEISSIGHFEELALFGPEIGADRISDITCNVLKQRFIRYTKSIATRHGITAKPVVVPKAQWDGTTLRWMDERVPLPVNPYTKRGVLLTPGRFLRKLPTVDPVEFWDWAWSNENETLRDEFNYHLGRNVAADEIVKLARTHPEFAKRYIEAREKNPGQPYDLKNDPRGEVSWYDDGLTLARTSTLAKLPKTAKAFCDWVGEMIDVFRHNLEQQDGWRLLWVKDKERSEKHAQALFRTAMWRLCQEHDVDFSGEPNAGRGPVDFKFSQGWERRSLVEIKLMNNTRFWHGLASQTKQYLISEKVSCGFFVALGFRDQDFSKERLDRLNAAAEAVSKENGLQITPVVVDARPKKSASKK